MHPLWVAATHAGEIRSVVALALRLGGDGDPPSAKPHLQDSNPVDSCE